jgi:signal transduction histidine kinase
MLTERLKGYDVGADDYITKPFDEYEMRAKVGIFMRLKKTEEISKLKSNFLTLISHETHTPLNGIYGFAQILRESENINNEEKEYIENIIDSALTLTSFINKASLFSQLKSGEIELTKEVCHPAQILKKVVSDYNTQITEKKLTVKFEGSTQEAYLDKSFFEKTATFLLDNSIKASEETGKIVVKTTIEANDRLTFSIEDEGSGISPEALPTIFEEMHSNDIAHHSTGHHLSLPIVKEIAKLHGGKASASNNKTSGVTVTVELSIKK